MTKKKEEETAVATTAGTEVVIAEGLDYGEDMGRDADAIDNSEIKIPFLKLLQEKSRNIPEGASHGMLLNTATGEFYDGREGVQLITVHRIRRFVEWKPESTGGGIVRKLDEGNDDDAKVIDQCRKDQDFGQYKNPELLAECLANTPQGKAPNLDSVNDIIETVYVWAMLVDNGSFKPVVLSLSKGKIGPWHSWVRMAVNQTIPNSGGQKPPFFAHQIRLGVDDQKDDYGNWKIKITPLINDNYIESLAPMGSAELAASKEMRQAISDGMYKMDESMEVDLEQSATSSTHNTETDGDAPF